ncbi:sigma 54-interacting transcriptional regulator [Shigella sonnei]
MAFDCTLPEQLLESELWSCTWRVYWRCQQSRRFIQAAEGGTLLLDEMAICPHRCRSNCCACCRSVRVRRWQ